LIKYKSYSENGLNMFMQWCRG